MQKVSTPTYAASLLQRVKDGAKVDKNLAGQALDAVRELDLKEARGVVKDLLASSKDITPGAREALEAFVAAAEARPEKSTYTGILERWRGRSPGPRDVKGAAAEQLKAAVSSATTLLLKSPKDVLADALEKIDPVLAETVRLDSKYTIGLAGFATMFPALGRALETFEKATEPATALMTAALQELPPPPPLSAILKDVKNGVELDLRHTLDLLRAATVEGADRGVLLHVLADAKLTEAAKALLEGFAKSRSTSVDGRYYDAYVSEARARDLLDIFDRTVGKLDPELAKVGHSVLLLSGQYEPLNDAWDKLDRMLRDRSVENWSQTALEVFGQAVRELKGSDGAKA